MPKTQARSDYSVREARQIRALRSPARQEFVDGLQAIGPCSIAELGALLGRAPDSLYYHLRALERVGLVVEKGSRRSGARTELLYDTPGRLILDHQPHTSSERRDLMQLARSVLRSAERDLQLSLDSGLASYSRGPQRNAWCARVKGWLTPQELTRLRQHLEAAAQLLVQGRRRPDAQLHTVAFALAPLAPSKRGRSPHVSKRSSR